jgi:hypothetical protein
VHVAVSHQVSSFHPRPGRATDRFTFTRNV